MQNNNLSSVYAYLSLNSLRNESTTTKQNSTENPSSAKKGSYMRNKAILQHGSSTNLNKFALKNDLSIPKDDMKMKPVSYFCLILIRTQGISKPLAVDTVKTRRVFLIPDQADCHKGRKTLVLDLDETLVHSSFNPIPNADIIITVQLSKE